MKAEDFLKIVDKTYQSHGFRKGKSPSGEDIRVEVDGDMVRANSPRLVSFLKHGITCEDCGVSGAHFHKDFKTNQGPHMGLYTDDGTLMVTLKLVGKTNEEKVENAVILCRNCKIARDKQERE